MIKTNIAIRTTSPDLVDFFYPNFRRTSEFSPFLSGGVIFDGDSKYLQSFRDNKIPYIYVKGTPEYDLTIPENLLKFVFDKWDKVPTKALEEKFKEYDKTNKELENIAKIVWVTGKYTNYNEDLEKGLEHLYSLLVRGNKYEVTKKILELSELYDKEIIFNKIKRFLKDQNNASSIKNYRIQNIAKAFNETNSKYMHEALMDYLYSPADSIDIKLIRLFATLITVKRF